MGGGNIPNNDIEKDDSGDDRSFDVVVNAER